MGLFDDIPMADDLRAPRGGGFNPAAGHMRIPVGPPEDEEVTDLSDPIRLAQARLPPVSRPGIPGGVGVSPDAWDEWRKGALKGIIGSRAFYRRAIGSFGGGGNDDGCKEEREAAREACIKEFADGWRGNNVHGPFKTPDGTPWSIRDCVRGLVSERCGGNKIDYGRDKDGKPRKR